MHTTPSILTALVILLATGCAAVDPNPNGKAGLALIDDQEVTAAGMPNRVQLNGGKFWQQVRGDFRLSDTRHDAVSKRVALYTENARQVERILQRGEPYLAYIYHEVEKRGFPGEVVLLPFIESGYDPFAYSHGRAAGLWQFIPSTGTYFGLKQDWWYDERRDVIASTDAALTYLDKLQKEFNGDWLLAFAAYNAGGGTIRNAIKRNREAGKPTDFWHLELRDETTGYVPKLLAISRIVSNPGGYGVQLPVIDSAPGFAVIETGNQLDIVVAAELADMETDAFYRINPGFNRWATHPEGPHQLAIPVDKAHTFSKNLAELPASERVKWVRHRLAKGETLSHIAQRYQTTVKVLQQSNNLDATGIRAGSHLLVPVAAKDASRYAALDKRLQPTRTSDSRISYQVENGDNLWAIAHQHKVSVAQLKKWNQLDSGSLIKPGQQLVIWKDGKGTPAGKHVRTINYTVRSGDSLYAISKKYSVSIADLQRWNNIRKDKYLKPGQKLKVHVDVTRLTST
jgi:membrane-bound lytic murein transglycosylase D